ncbi:MAG TPA: zinc ribbon domain-containing protein [Nitrososphaeraceae archaeon]|nr:zinc ribbon domain-containing protein [Nitrososphaeraceae archaeon]
MKAFNGRAASEEYMSTHSLTFSTPEMTLKKFVLWLGEQVTNPSSKERVPRLMLYIEEKTTNTIGKENSNLMPDTDDTFRPSGAVTEMYGGISSSSSLSSPSSSYPTNDITLPKKGSIDKKIPDSNTKFCFECGSNLKTNSKFCRNCGTKQE